MSDVFDPSNHICPRNGCTDKMEQLAELDGTWVLWCPHCGTALQAEEGQPANKYTVLRIPRLVQ